MNQNRAPFIARDYSYDLIHSVYIEEVYSCFTNPMTAICYMNTSTDSRGKSLLQKLHFTKNKIKIIPETLGIICGNKTFILWYGDTKEQTSY